MPLEKRSFMGGMNKDTDIRLIQNPDYIDALNVRAATSVDGTIGSLENIEGNVEVPFDFYSTDPETFFVNDNGLYEEINPATVFYQKVIRIQGWEQTNQAYNFSLFSVGPNGNVLIGEFNWNGNTGHTFTSFYLNSQFSSIGPFNGGINVYDINTGNQFTASVKLLSFGQNSMLHGGYFDIVIECDVAGVNFDLSVSSNIDSDNFIYTYGEQGSGIPISINENVSIFLLPGFESGGVFNSDADDDGIVVSPNGTLYEVGNRTVWRIVIQGEQPTSSPANFDPITIFSYRENLNPAQPDNAQEDYEFLELLTIDDSTFSSGEFEFDSNQNSLSAFLHNEFSQPKSVLCDGLPLTFSISPENFFLTFSENATFDSTNNFTILVIGPVGVKFKLALANSSETLNEAFSTGDVMIGNNAADFSIIFDNGNFISLHPYQIVDNSIEITSSIVDSYDALQLELANAIQNYYELEQISIQQNINNNNLQADLEAQTLLTDEAIANLGQTETNLEAANTEIASLNGTISELYQGNDILSDQNVELLEDIQNLNIGLEQLNTAILNLNVSNTPSVQGSLTFNALAADVILLISQVNQLQTSQQSFINDFNDTFEQELLDADLPLATDFINIIIFIEDIISNITNAIEDQADATLAETIADYQGQIDSINAAHDVTVSSLETASDQAVADANALHTSEINAQQQYYLNIIGSAETGQGLEGEIASLQSQNLVLDNQVFSLQESLATAESLVESLTNQLDQQRISDIVILSKLNEYDEFYQSITVSYNSSLILFNSLSLSNQIIYEEDFSSSSDFASEWVFYENIFEDNMISISSFDDSVINNPSGYEQNGYLKLHTNVNTYTAARLPYSSFQTSSGWQHGSEVAIQMQFEVVSTEEFMSIPPGLSVHITNEWDNSNEFDSYDFHLPYSLTVAGGQNNSISFSHSFTVDDPNNEYINERSNITIIIPPVQDHIEIRLINIRIGNDSQEMFSFNLNNDVPQSRDFYLERYNEVNDVVLNWQSSGIDTLSDFVSESTYNSILNKLIPGYSNNPNQSSNYTIGGRLQSYAEDVFDFSAAVQQQIYNQYVLYALASTVDVSALQALQEQHQLHVDLLNGQLEDQQAQIEDLEFEFNNAMDALDIYAGMSYDPILENLMIGDSIVSGLLSIPGPEPGLESEWVSAPTSVFSVSGDLGITPKWFVNGELADGDDIILITQDELQQLVSQPHSATNNMCTYITNKFSNNQAIEFEIPGGNYPTQVMHILFANFDENTTEFNSEIKATITAGVNWTNQNYQMISGNTIESVSDFLELPVLQILFYFNENEADNVTFSDEIYFRNFVENTAGGLLWVGTLADNPFYMVKPITDMINVASEAS